MTTDRLVKDTIVERQQQRKGWFKILGIALLVLLTVPAITWFLVSRQLKVDGPWWQQENLTAEVTWYDPMGKEHKNSIENPDQVAKIADLMKKLQAQERAVQWMADRAGALTYNIVLHRKGPDLGYSLQSDQIVVYYANFPLFHSIWSVDDANSQELIQYLRDLS